MVGALLQLAKKDAAFFAGIAGWQVDITISTPDGYFSAPVTGLGTGTWLMLDVTEQGKSVNSKSNSIDIPEQQLIDAGYPYMKNGKVSLKFHKVVVNDNASMSGTYVINESHPNSTLGLLICTLGRSE